MLKQVVHLAGHITRWAVLADYWGLLAYPDYG